MGGTGFDIEIEAIDGAEAAPPPALYRAVSDIVTEAIYAFTKRRKAYQAIRVNHDRSYGESGNTPASLSFGFYDGGGGAMVSMDALLHWFTVILAALPLEEIAERSGYRVVAPRISVDATLVAEAEHSVFVELRGAVHQARRNKKGEIVIHADAGDVVDLNAKERALVAGALDAKRCPCLVCEALRAGKRPKVPKLPKPPKTQPEVNADGSWARKRQVQLEQVSEFPRGLLAAKRLERLTVREGGIDALPEELGDVFPHLTSLDLSRTNITRLPRSLANIAGLRSLTVVYQTLASVDEIADLASLKYLWLTAVGDVVEKLDCAKLGRVTTLDISRCKARTLPRNIGSMAQLESLHAQENALEDLPKEIARLAKLDFLNLDGNPLRAIPAALRELPLRSLFLGSTPLERIDVDHLPRSLHDLSIESCPKLHELPSLEALAELTSLNLDYTFSVVPESLRKLGRLEHLSIRQPKRISIPDWIGELSLHKLVVSASAVPHGEKARLAKLLPGAEIVVL